MLGTWKLNLEKSTWNAGNVLPPKSMTVTWVAEGQSIIGTLDEITGQDQPLKVVYMMNFDGQSHPITGSPLVDSGTYIRFGNTINESDFKNGKAVDIGQITLLSDKTLQGTWDGIFPNGRSYHLILVWDKQ